MNQNDLLQGTLELLILRVLASGERHGYGIAKRIEQVSGNTFLVKMGSLYPALNRLESKAYVNSYWGQTDTGRKAKIYALTDDGRRQIETETNLWDGYVNGINRILKNA
ncbi:MAG: PadR family transcriptional regulator [Opitutales bacterium]|nr:PadR family transcriptional regulator [Opitutales bacterium]